MTTKQKLALGLVILGAAAAGAIAAWYIGAGGSLVAPEGVDEEEPPIIVENGSVRIAPLYAVDGSWGQWTQDGAGPAWHYEHDTAEPGGNSSQTSVHNGNCQGTGQTPSGVMNGSIQITYTNGQESRTLRLLVNPQGVTRLVLSPSETATQEPNAVLRILDPAPNPDPAPWRLDRVEPSGGSSTDFCTFPAGSNPMIIFRRTN